MPKRTTTNETSTGQPTRDWERLIDDAQLMLDGAAARIERTEREIRRLLGGHQNAAQIMQILGMESGRQPHETYGAMIGKRLGIEAKLKTYRSGQQNEQARTVSSVPVNPDDTSKDVTVETPAENGKVAAAV